MARGGKQQRLIRGDTNSPRHFREAPKLIQEIREGSAAARGQRAADRRKRRIASRGKKRDLQIGCCRPVVCQVQIGNERNTRSRCHITRAQYPPHGRTRRYHERDEQKKPSLNPHGSPHLEVPMLKNISRPGKTVIVPSQSSSTKLNCPPAWNLRTKVK